MSSSTSTAFFLDSCVVLGYVVGQHQKKLGKLSADIAASKLACCVSDSVESECATKIRGLRDFLGQVIMGVVAAKVETQRRSVGRSLDSPVDHRDVVPVELAFREMYAGDHKLPSSPTSNVLDLQTVEIGIVNVLETMIHSPKPPDFFAAMTELTKFVLKYTTDVKTNYDVMVAIQHKLATVVTVSPSAGDTALLETLGLTLPDARHVASAYQAQKSGVCKKAVFVSLDFRTILIFQIDVLKALGIWCTDPIYAVYHQ